MTGELVADLDALRRSHVEQRDAAIARGDHAAASREGHEAASASTALLRIGIEDGAAATRGAYHDRLDRVLGRASTNRPGFAREIKAAAEQMNDREIADDAEVLASYAENYNSTH
jgi:hypothetical protein